jgi:O-antigen/teichoic acid export membrane protein
MSDWVADRPPCQSVTGAESEDVTGARATSPVSPPATSDIPGPSDEAPSGQGGARPPGRRAVLGVLLLSGSNAFRLSVQFLLFPVLARLLSPGDYGLIALAMPVVLFAFTLGEGGMGPAAVRAPDPRGDVEATMYWAALANGAGYAVILLAGAPLIAAALSNAKVAPVLMWLAPILVLSAMCSVPVVRIQKRGAVWIFALSDVVSTLGGAAIAFAAALTGWGVWSLVAQQLVIWIVKLVVLTGFAGFSIHRWPRRDAFRYLIGHGMPVVGANLMRLFANSVDALLIGRLLGVELLGFYALSYQIVRIPEAVLNGPVLVSFLPVIARLDGDRPAAARLFLGALRMTLSVSAPLMLGMALTADLSVPLLLGARWQATAPLLMLLAPPAVVQTLGWLSMGLLLGRGRSGLQFKLALLNAGLTLAGVLAGAPYGIFGIATGVACSVVIGNLAYLVAAMREVGVSVRSVAAAIAPTLAAATIMAVGVAGLRMLIVVSLPAPVSLLVTAGFGMLLYVGAMQVLAPQTLGAALVLFRRPGGSSAG